ncbi:hypothetical protein JG688_00007255 [Phytophthora aleatoria]|uniref:Uncharacterized protein n=1 Tax=Phytophthora aleatoria TaxID=2496075 RepID=A0A8J5ISK5_9STRA|nr:hypothetical protein JG688_00007255 [Phytophthora aleatoria]
MPESIEIAVLSASWGEIFKMLSSNAGESFSVLRVVLRLLGSVETSSLDVIDRLRKLTAAGA